MSFFTPLFIAITLLTRLPIYAVLTRVLPAENWNKPWTDQQHGLSVLWYPAVGLLLALCLGGVILILPDMPPLVMATITVSVWVLLTGALHLDGLADSVDAACAAHRLLPLKPQAQEELAASEYAQAQQKLLAVFKDPTAGPMAVVTLLLVLLLKVVLLTYMMNDGVLVLVVTLVVSRAAALLLLLTTPYVGASSGMGALLSHHLSRPLSYMVLALVIFFVSVYLPILSAFLVLLTVVVIFFAWRYFWLNTLQGIVGDCIGALIELTEVAILLVLCIVAYSYGV